MANSNAGASSSSNTSGAKYQVFLSFRGPDTRDGFTSFLHRDLRKNGVHAFLDDEELRFGEEIGGDLLRAIDDSRIYIPIFSRNYASSKWCLRELARMVDNKSNSEEKKILPIFYDVEPKDVNLETTLYTTAIEKHKKEPKEEGKEKFLQEVESWEKALKKVDKVKGWELPKCKNQGEAVDSVVQLVLQELRTKYKSVTKDLVGLDDRVAEVLELLDVNRCDEVRLLGIHGMGGIGKTTLAKVVYNELSSRFGKCCACLDGIRKTSKEGLISLQKKLLTEIGNSSAAGIIGGDDCGRERIEATLGSEKVLIVLDDVDEDKQIENLIGQNRLHPGTRIIITTRNAGVLEFTQQRMAPKTKEVNSDHAIQILSYEMEGMNSEHALQLFKRHAFPEGSLAKDFDSLSRDIVNTTGGLPLALEVIGSLLCRKNEAIWKDTLHKLKDMPHENVQKQLMISYETLNDHQRNIFLDVACFFINEDMMNAIYMWTDCKFYPNLEIDALVQMSLIKIRDNKFWMHDQLRDLGREIVRQQSPTNLEKRSRLWTRKEILDLVRTEERHEDVEALDLNGWSSDISISNEEIGKFKNLRFFRSFGGTIHGDSIVCLPNLRWISWHPFSTDFSVPRVSSKNLVVLELSDTKFIDDSKLWDLIKMATKLKNLDLVQCSGITRTPDLSGCLDLERLRFEACESLKEIDSSVGKLRCLLDLSITDCRLIEEVPDEIGGLVKLKRFSLRSCHGVSRLPNSIGNLESLRKLDLSVTGITSLPKSIKKLRYLSDLCLQYTKIRQLPNFIGKLTSLRTLDLSKFESEENIDQWELPKAIGMLDKLEELNLRGHNELVGEIPNEIGHLSSLRVLDLCYTGICRIPGTINRLSRLSRLDLTRCDEITELPELPASLDCLRVISRSLQVVPNLSNLTNLVELVLSDGSKYGDSSNLKHAGDLGWIGRQYKREMLKSCLPHAELRLRSLLENLTFCGLDSQPLEQPPPSLLSLQLEKFSSTGLLLSNLKILSVLTLGLSRLREIQLGGLPQLEFLYLDRCGLRSLSIPSSLRTLIVDKCLNMIEIQFLGMSASLEELIICNCGSIGRIVLGGEGGSLGVLDQSESSSSESTDCSLGVFLLPNTLKKLERLRLKNCTNLLEIQVIGTLLSLLEIHIYDCHAMEKWSGISNLKNLRSLTIDDCSQLRVVEVLDELEFLSRIHVVGCPSLENISNLKIHDECFICVFHCGELLSTSAHHIRFKRYKEMAQQSAPQPETNKEAKMETPPGKQNQTTEQDSNPLSLDELGKQNQTTEQDSNPLSLDELAPPRTFCDSFKTCLVSILGCICNRELSWQLS